MLFVAFVIIVYYLKFKISKRKAIAVETEEKTIAISTTSEPNVAAIPSVKDCRPRCGAPLVKRHGPYGSFYGCDNFASKGCRYTRKFK